LKKFIKILFILFTYISQLFYITSIYCQNKLYDLDINKDINWWSLGREFRDSPAIGFSYITFAIFIFILFYYGKKILNIFFHKRFFKIKKKNKSK
jgi:hypothetical protein